jgi:hypothetical protein
VVGNKQVVQSVRPWHGARYRHPVSSNGVWAFIQTKTARPITFRASWLDSLSFNNVMPRSLLLFTR